MKKSFVLLLMLLPMIGYAAGSESAQKGGGLNMLLVGLVSLIVVFVFVIGAAANVLKRLSQAIMDKQDRVRAGNGDAIKSLMIFFIASAISFSASAAEDVAETAPHVNWDQQMISGIPAFDFYLLMGILALEMLVIFSMLLYIRILIKVLSDEPETEKTAKHIIKVSFWDKLNKVVPIEKERDIMLDHDYDGIKELDNSLPPWWKYGFYLTIVVGVIYLWRFHISETGPSSYQEYVAEVQKGEEEKAAYLAKSANNVDENTVTLLTDDGAISSGKKIFETSCAACHAADGGGGVGPNLTDEFWLHGGSIQDVFKSIKYGWQDKGMKSWKDDFSPKQIAEISSYVKTLSGSKPAAPKEPQGEKYTEQQAAPVDSAKSVAQK